MRKGINKNPLSQEKSLRVLQRKQLSDYHDIKSFRLQPWICLPYPTYGLGVEKNYVLHPNLCETKRSLFL